jgi:bacillithiol synthase
MDAVIEHAISQTAIPHTTRLVQDFLYHFERVSEFYSYRPFARESFAMAAATLHYPDAVRASVVEVLREHQQRFDGGAETARNLDRLARPGCYAVVTGQQVGLFSGPAFTLYKALTAIKLARTLTERGIEAVPVFWLATEDHDLAEVNHCYVQDREGRPARLEYSEPAQVPNAPVAAVVFNEAIRNVVATLRGLLPEHADALGARVAECYTAGSHLGSSFARLLGNLLSKFGVIMVESFDARLHGLSRHVFAKAAECAPEINGELRERSARLLQGGFHAQVRVAENSTTLFLYEEGQRSVLHLEQGRFVTSSGREYSASELLELVQAKPELVSPNALLRPVMQDSLLPTVAYVGGPSEIAYLAQAAPLYQRILGRVPVFFPRASFTVLDPASKRLLGKYGLTLPDVFSGRQSLREKMAARYLPEGLTAQFEETTERLTADLAAIKQGLEKLDPTLAAAAANSEQKMLYQLSHLERRAAAAVQHRSDQVEKDAARLENNLYPEKSLQERLYCGLSLLASFGLPLLDQLYHQIPLESGDHQILSL